MADIEKLSRPNRKAGVKRLNKKMIRVDLTPMVDLGFLLVTFFVFTTTMASPHVMNVNVPNDKINEVTMDVCSSCALTLLLGDSDKIWYYEEEGFEPAYRQTTYNPEDLRKIITGKKQKVISVRGSDQLQLIIKPTAESSLKNLVDIMDEVSIGVVKKYFLDEPTIEELKKVGGSNIDLLTR